MLKVWEIFAVVLLLKCLAPAQITIACAPNMKYAMDALVAKYGESGKQCKLIYAASGVLAAQIKNGAPYDLFVSADTQYPESLFVHGFTSGKPRVYAYGRVVLWTAKNIDLTKGIAVLESPDIVKIAMPDPKNAPYGRAAVSALKKTGLFESVTPKLVFGESIAQTAQYIVTQSVDIGFNAKGIVVGKPMEGKGKWIELDTAECPAIAQAAVVCEYGQLNNPAAAKQFDDFLFSQSGAAILEKNGYDIP